MTNNRTITEAKVQKLSERLYGVNPQDRVHKLEEEIRELFYTIEDHECIDPNSTPTLLNGIECSSYATIYEVKDELADCLFILISIMGIYDTNIRELTEIAIHKIKQREIDPNFKR